METYQPIFDAVRSRISNGNIGEVVADAARQAFDISWARDIVMQEMTAAAYEHRRPTAVFKPELSVDGNAYCFLLGEDLMSGVAGFGETVEQAAADFDKNWHAMKAPRLLGPVSASQ